MLERPYKPTAKMPFPASSSSRIRPRDSFVVYSPMLSRNGDGDAFRRIDGEGCNRTFE
jgi:hypothetical protein